VAALHLINEDTGTGWRVWPEPEAIPQGCVHETGRYIFELKAEDIADKAELLIDGEKLEALRAPAPGLARWRWLPGFHAGTVDLELRIPGIATRNVEVITDPDRRKLTRDDFDTMVRETLNDTFALFSLSGFRKAVARGGGNRAPAIARLEFLRSRVAELERVIADILRHPRRLLAAQEVDRPYHRASRATGPEILRSFRTGRLLREKSQSTRLPPALKGFLPERIRLRERRSSIDIPEHRQIAACLRYWAAWLNSAADNLEKGAGDAELRRRGHTWAVRSRRLARRISNLAATPAFSDVGPSPAHLVLSPVFRQDPAYRRFYRLWQDMNLGIAAIFGNFLSLPLARTFELYELWCFLRLVRAAAEEFGPEGLELDTLFVSDAAGGVTIAASAVTVPVGSGWSLCFQKQYREYWVEADGRGSYSRTMAPDVSVHQAKPEGPGCLIVLDAKYRIDEGLNDALSSVHTYRDALVTESAGTLKSIVSAAYLLAPHVPDLQPGYRDTPLPGRLFHPSYRGSFRFGAVTLRPGMSTAEMRATLKAVVADATAEGE
jgi:hypothetical protein